MKIAALNKDYREFIKGGTITMNECKYRLPCGWCERRNKVCEVLSVESPINISPYVPNSIQGNRDLEIKYSDTASSPAPKKTCGACTKTDGMCYTSNPPKVKCTITGRFHEYGDECDVEYTTVEG